MSIENLILEFMKSSPLFIPAESAELQRFLDPANPDIPWDAFLKAGRESLIGRMTLMETAMTMTCPLAGTVVVNPDAVSALILNAFWHGAAAALNSKDSSEFESMMKKMMEEN